MIIIGDKIISDDLLGKQFVCNLNACKGICCVEGDEGAPLEKNEVAILEDIYEDIKPFLDPRGIAVLEKEGRVGVGEKGQPVTPLVEGKACAYVTYDDKGITKCGIEKAYEEGVVSFWKPVSCHLYPVRIEKYAGFDAVNYSVWDICSPACKLGADLGVPVYKFVKEALVRKYGEAFYEELDAAASYQNKSKQ